MDAIEFVRNIYKGENIAECENHLESFLKQKVQELLPEHFEEIEKYKRISAMQEACAKDLESDDDIDDDVDEDDDDDIDDDEDEDEDDER